MCSLSNKVKQLILVLFFKIRFKNKEKKFFLQKVGSGAVDLSEIELELAT